MINCLIVEDEQAGQQILLRKLTNLYPECSVLSIIDNKNEAVEFINNNDIDLVFLDVQIIGGTGIDILQECQKRNFEVIFITAYDNFAISALNENASYYLLKPIIDEEFAKGMSIVLDKIKQSKTPSKLLVPNKGVYLPINLSDILYFESDGAYTLIVTLDDQVLSSKNIGYYEKTLPPELFKRPHHSYIVNIVAFPLFRQRLNIIIN